MTRDKKGYTLVELLVFVAISAVVAVSFISILVVIIRIQGQQSSAGEVDQQSGLLLQQLQYYVANSSLIDIAANTPTTTLKLRMASSTVDPTFITLASSTVYLQQGSGAATALTSNKVAVSNLSFVKGSNGSGHDSVNISFTMAYNSQNLQQLFAQSFQGAVGRVSAATFDSDLLPSTGATWNLGNTGSAWKTVNGVMYFNGSNVGIGPTSYSPAQAFEVRGGNIYIHDAGAGLMFKDTGGNCWLVSPNVSGTLMTAAATCPVD